MAAILYQPNVALIFKCVIFKWSLGLDLLLSWVIPMLLPQKSMVQNTSDKLKLN